MSIYMLSTQGLPVQAVIIGAVLFAAIVLAVLAAIPKMQQLFGTVSGLAATVIVGGLVFMVIALVSPDCPSSDPGRCDVAETATWWLNGALVVTAVLALRAGAYAMSKSGRLIGRIGRRTAAVVTVHGKAAAVDVATRDDGLFTRPIHRDRLVWSGAAAAAVTGVAGYGITRSVAAGMLSALCGFMAAGTMPAAWRLPKRRPDVWKANRSKASKRTYGKKRR